MLEWKELEHDHPCVIIETLFLPEFNKTIMHVSTKEDMYSKKIMSNNCFIIEKEFKFDSSDIHIPKCNPWVGCVKEKKTVEQKEEKSQKKAPGF